MQRDRIDPRTFDRMQREEPIEMYIKTTVGKLGVIVWDQFEQRPTDLILVGDPHDPNVDLEKITVKIWDEVSGAYFKNANRAHFEAGRLSEYTGDRSQQPNLVNVITDEEIREILQDKFFTLKNRLSEFTSEVPVRRFLEMAYELDRPVGTINHIKKRLEELLEERGLGAKNLEEFYQNLDLG